MRRALSGALLAALFLPLVGCYSPGAEIPWTPPIYKSSPSGAT